jgi:Cystathionine beta-lyases/cystathionine gamma-synthases
MQNDGGSGAGRPHEAHPEGVTSNTALSSNAARSSNTAQSWGDSTRAVLAAAADHIPGTPMLQGPVLAAPYQLGSDEAEVDTYGRASNPGWRDLERALAELEGAAEAIVVGSGMSAATVALRALLSSGDTVVVPADGYYQVRAYARERLAPFGVRVVEARADGMIEAAARGATVVFAETPANPSLDVVDLRALSSACTAGGALLVVDNTTPTPLGQQPLALGADLVVASGTKALTGHSDLLMGYLATGSADLADRLRRERLLSGAVLGPFEAWLALRSLGSAGLRYERQCATALALAEALRDHSAVSNVRYPGLPGDPAHVVSKRQMRRFGGLVGFELPSVEAFHRFVAASDLVRNATSFGGLHTTVDRRARWGDPVPPGFTRLSCGIEDTTDVVADVVRALATLA